MSPYTRLNTEANEIRLLDLDPATHYDDPLVCSLRIVSLVAPDSLAGHGDDYPYFEAISYAWGDLTKTHQITVDSVPGFAITASLATALRTFRYYHEPGKMSRARTLWADAVCINQEDVLEMNAQVSMMAQIYSTAADVLVWLGPSTPDMVTAFSALQEQGLETVDVGERQDQGCFPVQGEEAVVPSRLARTPRPGSTENREDREDRGARSQAQEDKKHEKDVKKGPSPPTPPPNPWFYPEDKLLWTRATSSMADRDDLDRRRRQRLRVLLGADDVLAKPYWDRMWTFQECLLAQRPPLCHAGMNIRFRLTNKVKNALQWLHETHYHVLLMAQAAAAAAQDGTGAGNEEENENENGPDHLDTILTNHYRHHNAHLDASFAFSFQYMPSHLNPMLEKRTEPQSLFMLLRKTARRRCTDQRDHIYGLFGLFDPAEQAALPVDYRKPVAEVWHRATLYMWQHDRFVRYMFWQEFVLRPDRLLPGGWKSGTADASFYRCPSWVPDFGSTDYSSWRNGRSWSQPVAASLYKGPQPQDNKYMVAIAMEIDVDHDPFTMQVRGRHVATVQSVLALGDTAARVQTQVHHALHVLQCKSTQEQARLCRIFAAHEWDTHPKGNGLPVSPDELLATFFMLAENGQNGQNGQNKLGQTKNMRGNENDNYQDEGTTSRLDHGNGENTLYLVQRALACLVNKTLVRVVTTSEDATELWGVAEVGIRVGDIVLAVYGMPAMVCLSPEVQAAETLSIPSTMTTPLDPCYYLLSGVSLWLEGMTEGQFLRSDRVALAVQQEERLFLVH